MIVPDLRKYQIRIPRKILGRNSGLTFVQAQKLKNRFFGHVNFLGGHVILFHPQAACKHRPICTNFEV